MSVPWRRFLLDQKKVILFHLQMMACAASTVPPVTAFLLFRRLILDSIVCLLWGDIQIPVIMNMGCPDSSIKRVFFLYNNSGTTLDPCWHGVSSSGPGD